MTILALSLFILACGWKFIKDWRFTRFSALKNSGHPQYFGAAIAAVYIACLAASINAVFSEYGFYRTVLINALTYIPHLPKDGSEAVVMATLAAIAAWSFFLACFLSWVFNHFLFRDPRLLVAVARKVGSIDELEALCLKCLETGMLLAITLKSGKVYVGVPEGYSAIDGEKKWLALWPMASGYRDEKKNLELTTFYSPHYELASVDGNGPVVDDFRVVLPRAEVSSAQSFDLTTYASFGVADNPENSVPRIQPAAAEPPQTVDRSPVEAMIDAVVESEEGLRYQENDNAKALILEIIPLKDATLFKLYMGFVLSFSASILLASGSPLVVIAIFLAFYFFVRLWAAREG